MQRKSFVIMAALVLGLALGVAFRPALVGVSASAQTPSPTPSAAPSQTQPKATGTSLREEFLNQLASALGIQRAALDSAITSAGNSTADAAVQQGTLTQAQADALKQRVQAGDVGSLFGGRGGGRGFGGGPQLAGVQQAMLDAAAKALNLTTDELKTQLRSGQTLAQLAQANNTTEQAVTNAALAAAKTQLDQAVANGTLTQAQADAAYAEIQQRGLMLKGPGGHGRGGRGPRGTPTNPATPASPAPSSTSTNL